MKWVILGASGFIGRRLCQLLQKNGQVVRIIPRDMYGNFFALEKYLAEEEPEIIVNLAAYGNHSNQKDPHTIYEANVTNTLHLLEASKNIPYKLLLLTGSSSEYGIKTRSMSEKDSLDTTSFYGASKVAQFHLARVYRAEYKKPIAVVRPFSVYGPGEADFRFIPTVCKALIQQKSFVLTPFPTHDWIYIDDFIDGLLAFSLFSIYEEEIEPAINIGTGFCITNEDVVALLKQISDTRANYTTIPDSSLHDSPLWVANTQKIHQLTGWKPKHTLLEGLTKTFAYYKEQYEQ